MAVVVQRMVDPVAAGVLFTANPITGCRTQMVVDAVPGLGDVVVDGSVIADHYVLDGRQADCPRRVPERCAAGASCGRPGSGCSGVRAWPRMSSGPSTGHGGAVAAAIPADHHAVPGADLDPIRPSGVHGGRPHAGDAAAVHPDGDGRDAGGDRRVVHLGRRRGRSVRGHPGVVDAAGRMYLDITAVVRYRPARPRLPAAMTIYGPRIREAVQRVRRIGGSLRCRAGRIGCAARWRSRRGWRLAWYSGWSARSHARTWRGRGRVVRRRRSGWTASRTAPAKTAAERLAAAMAARTRSCVST